MHASQHCRSILSWVSRGLPLSNHKNPMTPLCSSMMQTAEGVAMLKIVSFRLSASRLFSDSVNIFNNNVSSTPGSLIFFFWHSAEFHTFCQVFYGRFLHIMIFWNRSTNITYIVRANGLEKAIANVVYRLLISSREKTRFICVKI